MAYRNRNSFIKNISSIGKAYSGLLGGVSFVPSDYGYGGSDLYSGRYCKYGTSCLGGKWGAERYDTDYNYNGSPIPFAKAYLCPIPKRNDSIPVYYSGSLGWGNKGLRVQDTPYYIRYDSNNKYLYGGTSSNPTGRIGYGPIVMIDLQAGGGGGGRALADSSVNYRSGSGGGGGGYINVVLDLSKISGDVIIKVGSGGMYTTSGNGDIPRSIKGKPYDRFYGSGYHGGNSTISYKYGSTQVTLLAEGGGCGYTYHVMKKAGEDVNIPAFGGVGGTCSISGADLEILHIDTITGKSGGGGQLGASSSTHLEALPGSSFSDSDYISNYGIINDIKILTGSRGKGSSGLPTQTKYNRSVMGGGGGASVLGYGARRDGDYLPIGGGGGDGGYARAGWWLYEDLGYSYGWQGQDGCAVLHYATNL